MISPVIRSSEIVSADHSVSRVTVLQPTLPISVSFTRMETNSALRMPCRSERRLSFAASGGSSSSEDHWSDLRLLETIDPPGNDAVGNSP